MTAARKKAAPGLTIHMEPRADLPQVAQRQAAALQSYADSIARGKWPGGSINRHGKRQPDGERLMAREVIASVLRQRAQQLREFTPKRPRGNPEWTAKRDAAELALLVHGAQQTHPGESVERSIGRVLDRLHLDDSGPDASTIAKHYRAMRPTLEAMFPSRRRNSKRIVPSSK